MADALISPVIGGVMWAATTGVAAYSIKKVQSDLDDKKIPLMGIMGAFIFATQMINFTIPVTGSSGHLGGGLMLAILLGPYAGFLTMASILTIQALFFADGGLLALGCNIFNMGFFTCFIAYPLIYKPILSKGYSAKKIFIGAMLACIVGLQLGAFGVVLETVFSGKTELPFGTFVLLMQPIHLAISIVEGFVSVAVISFVWKARPEMLEKVALEQKFGEINLKKVISVIAIAAIITGGALSWFASANPDGLEWAMFKTAGTTELESTDIIHEKLADIQSKTAFLPDYGFKASGGEEAESGKAVWPAVNVGTSTSGFVGGALTLALAAFIGFFIQLYKKQKNKIIDSQKSI